MVQLYVLQRGQNFNPLAYGWDYRPTPTTVNTVRCIQPPHHLVTFGDGYNELSLFSLIGFAV